MTAVDDLIMLRSLVHAGGPIPDGVEVTRRDGVIDHARVPVTSPVALEDLTVAFGPGRDVPRQPAGGRRVIFPDTQPGDGQRAVTVIAELTRSGQVTAVVLRPDDFT